MDEVLWQLLCTIYDIPSSNFTKVYFLKLFMMTATNLGYAGNFTLSNFSRDKRDRRKWIHFLSCLVSWFECADTEILEVIEIFTRISFSRWLTKQEKEKATMQSS